MREHKRLLGVVAFVVLLLVTVQISGLRDHFNVAYVRDEFLAHKLNGLLIFVGLFCLGNLIQLPGILFLAAAVLSLGRMWGGIVTLLAAYVSCAITFGVFRWLGGGTLADVKSPVVRRVLHLLQNRPLLAVFVLRGLFQTAPALNVALALSPMGWRPYLLGTLLGLPLPVAAYCVFFDFVGAFVRSH